MTSPSHNKREELREKILSLNGCIGPYDYPHRCSAMHCDHCGLCDVAEDILAIIEAEQHSLLTRVKEGRPTSHGETEVGEGSYFDDWKQGYNACLADYDAHIDRVEEEL